MKLLPLLALTLGLASGAVAQEPPRWLRYPAISPDGQTVLFEYKGDLWSVPAAGGTAAPLTVSESYEYAPVWSHDGRDIAFASDRYGNFDVFVMRAGGGEARRLTFHSAAEIPSSFTADDAAVLFASQRQDPASNAQFPSGVMSELYRVPAVGGRVARVLAVPAPNAVVDAGGARLLYTDTKGQENAWRKHHTSSVTRDIWLYDGQAGSYRQITTSTAEDRNPVFGEGADDYYWLSERDGTFNLYQGSLSDPTKATPLTRFTKHPVRFLTRANNGTMCFGFDGDLYTLRPGAEPVRLQVRLAIDGRANLDKVVPVNEEFTELVLAPSGKEFAYVFRGEIFVSSVEGGVTKRLTDTPWQERSVGWSPDGRTLVYAAEVDQSWNVYTMTIARAEEPYFYASTVLKTEPVVATEAEEFQPAFSPDGKEIAYLEERVALKVVNLATKQTRLVLPAAHNYSYADGDQYYQWSPDSKWLLVQFGLPERVMSSEIGLVAADGQSAVTNLTLSGYDDATPKWVLDGKAMIWGTNRDGALQQGGGAFTWDVHGLFFSREAFDRFRLSKEDFALVKELEEKKDEVKVDAKDKKDKKDKEKADDKTPPADVVIDRDNLTERRVKLTTHTSPASDWVLSKDGEKLFYVTSFEKGDDLWVIETRTGETSQLAKVGGDINSFTLSPDGDFLVFLADGKPKKVDIEKGELEPLKTSGEMVLKPADERAYIFDHVWRQLKRKFYVQDLHGVDWDWYREAYRDFLPHINNNYDFAEMLSEMLGEMNASHTGCYYRPTSPTGDQTASLGLFYDDAFTGDGLKVAEVIAGGPLDKATARLRAGHVIEKIDGQPVAARDDYGRFLNRRAGQRVLLSVFDPAKGARWDEEVKPISAGDENELLYKRWVRNRRDEVTRLSGGRIGYVHVRAMNDASMRVVFEEALGRNLGTEALIVDTRFNGGGNIHDQLSDFLAGQAYFDIIPHGQFVGSESYDKWTKPSIVLMGEANYSDAHLFPVAYKVKGVGRTLGMPVPGTGTFVWWERQIDPTLRFGIPMGGWRGTDGKFCENTQLEPDVLVRNEPDVITAGRDQQIEAAVRELLNDQ